MATKEKRAWLAIVGAGAVVVGVLINMFLAPMPGDNKVWAWGITMAMILVLCASVGSSIANRWDGVLVDSRNRVSAVAAADARVDGAGDIGPDHRRIEQSCGPRQRRGAQHQHTGRASGRDGDRGNLAGGHARFAAR